MSLASIHPIADKEASRKTPDSPAPLGIAPGHSVLPFPTGTQRILDGYATRAAGPDPSRGANVLFQLAPHKAGEWPALSGLISRPQRREVGF